MLRKGENHAGGKLLPWPCQVVYVLQRGENHAGGK